LDEKPSAKGNEICVAAAEDLLRTIAVKGSCRDYWGPLAWAIIRCPGRGKADTPAGRRVVDIAASIKV